MFIHIGERKVVSDASIIGIFNRETLSLSEENQYYLDNTDPTHKTIVVSSDNSLLGSIVSPFTVISRSENDNEAVWRKA